MQIVRGGGGDTVIKDAVTSRDMPVLELLGDLSGGGDWCTGGGMEKIM